MNHIQEKMHIYQEDRENEINKPSQLYLRRIIRIHHPKKNDRNISRLETIYRENTFSGMLIQNMQPHIDNI